MISTSCTVNNQISAEHPYLPSLNCVCHEALPDQMIGPGCLLKTAITANSSNKISGGDALQKYSHARLQKSLLKQEL